MQAKKSWSVSSLNIQRIWYPYTAMQASYSTPAPCHNKRLTRNSSFVALPWTRVQPQGLSPLVLLRICESTLLERKQLRTLILFLPASLGCSFNNTPQGRSLRDTTLWQTVRKNFQCNRFVYIVFCSWFGHAHEALWMLTNQAFGCKNRYL